jgi:hypothetical protein
VANAWRSGSGHAIRVAGRRGAYQRASANDAVVARCVHIRTLALHGENSAELSETCR